MTKPATNAIYVNSGTESDGVEYAYYGCESCGHSSIELGNVDGGSNAIQRATALGMLHDCDDADGEDSKRIEAGRNFNFSDWLTANRS